MIKKRTFDPIDYECINKVDFLVEEDEPSPDLDSEELEVTFNEQGSIHGDQGNLFSFEFEILFCFLLPFNFLVYNFYMIFFLFTGDDFNIDEKIDDVNVFPTIEVNIDDVVGFSFGL